MPAHHKPSDAGSGQGKTSYDPHAGPVVGDACYRQHFASPAEFQAAMRLAAQLDAKGLHRRAWRGRWNIDGPQPVVAVPLTVDCDDDEVRPGRSLLQPVSTTDASAMIRGADLLQIEIAEALRVTSGTVSRWARGVAKPTKNLKLKLEDLLK